MAGTERTDRDPDRSSPAAESEHQATEPDRHPDDRDRRRFDSFGEWIAASMLRVALAILGFVVLLLGLSMAMGVDLIGMVAGVVNSEVGRWLLVALVGLVIILVAVRGFSASRA